MLISKYFKTKPSATVNNNFPPHLIQFPCKGGLLYFSLQSTHLNCCVLNFLKLPLISLIKCFSITNLATSDSSTARTFLAISNCPLTFSSIDGIDLYALHTTPLFMSEVSCVNPNHSYCFSVSKKSLTLAILTSLGILYCKAASYNSNG